MDKLPPEIIEPPKPLVYPFNILSAYPFPYFVGIYHWIG